MPSFDRIEGYAIVGEDGMLADARGLMPSALKVEADQEFFRSRLDDVDVVVHGRHSRESLRNSDERRRLIVTRQVPAVAADPSNPRAFFWNPGGATFEQALGMFGEPCAGVGVLGAADVFEMFLDRFDLFYLSRVSGVRLPGGRPIFRAVPARTPEDVLAAHGMVFVGNEVTVDNLTISRWRRSIAI